jgi:uncharacterized membrane protein/predicted heme/steroid binding protein
MLMPLDPSLFDSIAGLPLHPLVVHFAVVLLPLAALGLVLEVAVPRWADRFGGLTLAVLAVGTGAAFVAKQSGEALAQVGEPATHAAWGDLLPWLAAGLFILAAAWFGLTRSARRAGRPRSAASIAVGLAAAVMALVVTGATIVVGHTGATAAWGDVEASGQSADPVPSSTATSSASSMPTPSRAGASPLSGGSTTGSYTMADVAKHASASSCWTAIDGKVYDVTNWITRHPGGQRAILGLCGKDGSSAFNAQHGGQGRPAAELKQFLVGTLG